MINSLGKWIWVRAALTALALSSAGCFDFDGALGNCVDAGLCGDEPAPEFSTPAALTDGYTGETYALGLTVADGTPPLSFTVTAGALPAGLLLDGAGALSGSPEAAGAADFTVTVTDRIGRTAQRAFTLQTYAPPAVTTATIPDAYASQGYSAPLGVTGGKSPLTWTVTSGELPTGISLGGTGSLTGVAVGAGQAGFTVTATDANGRTGAAALTLSSFPLPTLPMRTLADAYVSVDYPESLAATGGKAPLTYSISVGAVPAGISFGADGVFAGSSSSTGNTSFTVTVTDANGRTQSQGYSVSSHAVPAITTPTLIDGYRNEAYSSAISSSGGKAPISFSISAGALPSGLTLSAGGALTGVPQAIASTQTFTVRATDANGVLATQSLSLEIYTLPALDPRALADSYVGSAYSDTVSAFNGKAPVTYQLASGQLPTGVVFSSAGAFSGTPTAALSATTLNVVATDDNGRTHSRSFLLGAYEEPAIGTASLSDVYTDTPLVGLSVATTGGKPALTFSISAGALPPGLALHPSTGALTGTATTPGDYAFTVRVADGNGHAATRALTWAVYAPPSLDSPEQLPDGVRATVYAETLETSGGKAPFTFFRTSGTLPAGLSLNGATGEITGTPSAVNSQAFFIRLTDANGRQVLKQFTLTIYDSMFISTGTNLASAYQDVDYSQQLAVAGGKPAHTWALAVGSTLPPDLILSASGLISGAPLAPVSGHVFSVVVTDANSSTATKSFNLTVAPRPSITTTSLPDGYVANPYSAAVQATGGKTPYVFDKSAGTFPSGITQSGGTGNDLVGTPSVANTFSFTMRVTDANALQDTQALSITTYAMPEITTAATLNDAYQDQAFSQTLQVGGGKAPFVWAVSSGAPATGLALSADGVLSGTATAAGPSSFSVTVTDVNGKSFTRPFGQTVLSPLMLTATFPDGYVGRAYASVPLDGTGGRAPYVFSVTASLPPGLSLGSGSVQGTPTTAGLAVPFGLQVRDANNVTTVQPFTVDLYTPPAVVTASLDDAYSGTAYSATLIGEDGKGAGYSWRISAGSLPTGLTLNDGGALTGTTTATGTHNFTVELSDANGVTATGPLSLIVRSPLQLTTSSLPEGYVGVSYLATLAASGGAAPYSFQLISGTPPGTVAVASDGAFSGVPDAAGTFPLGLQVTDANGAVASASLDLTVYERPSVTTTTLTDGYVQTSLVATLTATGGKAPYSWSVPPATLPPGLALSAAGGLTGTPTSAGSYPFTVTVTDANGQTGTAELVLEIHQKLEITTAALPDGYLTLSYGFTVAAVGGPAGGYTWSASGLPASLTLDAGSGLISGIPAAAGSSLVLLTVTDGNGITASRSLALVAYAMPRFVSGSPLADGYVASTYPVSLVATDGKGPYTLTTVDPLPPGLTLNPNGTFSGTISGAAGVGYPFTVQLRDSNNVGVSAGFTTSVLGTLVVDTVSVPDLYTATPYSLPFAVSGGKPAYSWSLPVGSSAPAGMTFSAAGLLEGSPTTAGTHAFSVRVTDGNARTAQGPITAQIFSPPLITTASLPNAYVGAPYSQALASTGGKTALSWSALGLPSFLSLDPGTGVISGTATVADLGSYPITVTLTDANGRTADQALTVNVLQGFFITSSTLPDGYTAAAYSNLLTATGGAPPYTWSAPNADLPAGLSLNAGTGELSGTPTTAGAYAFVIRANDSAAGQDEVTINLQVYRPPSVVTAALADGYLTETYGQTLAGADGKTPYSWSVTGSLPAGTTLTASTGVISGVPTSGGTSTFTVTLRDANNQTATVGLTLTIYALPFHVSPPEPMAGYRGVAYSFNQQGGGGKSPLTWFVDGALPAGLSLASGSGTISGTVSAAAATSGFGSRLRDANGREVSLARTIEVFDRPSNTSATFVRGFVNVAYDHPLSATGGVPPYTFSASPAGALPPGLSVQLVAGSWRLAGTPTTAGTYPFTLTVTDANGQTDADSYSVEISPSLDITTSSLPAAYAGEATYSPVVQATGGLTPYTFSLQSGALPSGLTLNANGSFSGSTNATGAFTFFVRVTDAGGSTDSQQLTLTVVSPPSISAGSAPPAYQGVAFNFVQDVVGGVGPYLWTISSGALPPGLNLDPAQGELTGVPTAAGTSSFVVSVSDANGRSTSRPYSLVVHPPLQLVGRQLLDAYAGAGYADSLAGSGGMPPYQYFLTTGSPPLGVGLQPSGQLNGTASTGAPHDTLYSFTVTVQDANGQLNSAPFGIRLYQPVMVTNTSLVAATEGVDYRIDALGGRARITTQFGKLPLAYSASGLPAGLGVNSAGQLVGIPAFGTFGLHTVVLTATDANNKPHSRTLSLSVNRPNPIAGGGTQAAAPGSSVITDVLTVFTQNHRGQPASDVAVRVRKNGAEYSPVKEAVTGTDGRVVFTGLGLNGTTDTVDLTANAANYTNTSFMQVNAALVTLPMEPHSVPGRRSGMGQAFDPGSADWFIFGGQLNRAFPSRSDLDEDSNSVCANDIVRMNGTAGLQAVDWVEARADGLVDGPPARSFSSVARIGSEVLLFGGQACPSGMMLDDVWSINPGTGTWARRLPTGGPGPRSRHALASSGGSGAVAFLFGGYDSASNLTGQLWSFQPSTNLWTQRFPAFPLPNGRVDHGMAVNPSTGHLWICGGKGSSGLSTSDCWSYNPSVNNWTAQASLPGPRSGHRLAFSSAGDAYVFGGTDSFGALRNDLLQLTGGTWSVLSPNGSTTGPSPRSDFAMAHDPANSRLLIYGGDAGGGGGGGTGGISTSDEVWARDLVGNQWLRLSPALGGAGGSTVQLTGTVSGGVASTNGQIELVLTTESGQQRNFFLWGASGSFVFDGLPSGQRMRLTALNTDYDPSPAVLSNFLSRDLGYVSSNQSESLVFGAAPLLTSAAGQLVLPPGWHPSSTASLSVFSAQAPTPAFAHRSGVGQLTGAIAQVDFFAPPGLETTARAQAESNLATTCARVTSQRRNVGASLGTWTLPGAPTDPAPGRSECAPLGLGFVTTGRYGGPSQTHSVQVGDFDGDGFPDLIAGSRGDQYLRVWLNQGDWLLQTGDLPTLLGFVPGSLAVADLDNDGNLDVLAADVGGQNRVLALYGNGNGTFQTPVLVFNLGIGASEALVIADFNNDGDLDFAVSDRANGNAYALYGDGLRNFSSPTAHWVGKEVSSLRSADIDGNGFPDLVSVSYADNQLRVWFGSAGGLLGPDVFSTPPLTHAVDLGDLDGDGDPDAVTISLDDNQVAVWFNAQGTLTLANSFSASFGVNTSVTVADFTGDGTLDIAVAATNNVVVFRNESAGTSFQQFAVADLGTEVRTLNHVDLNGDGALDVLGALPSGGTMWIGYLGRPPPLVPLATPFTFTAPANTRMMKLDRGAHKASLDWVSFSPLGAGPASVSLPLPSSLRGSRPSPINQLSAWSTTLVLDSAPLDVNNLRFNRLEPEAMIKTGARVFQRQ
ncbi:MAG: putative Ig domain-containing protein [Myxococcota bacterium]|nr:putative Ig domain-containing protein [Myxococcota bacterium]